MRHNSHILRIRRLFFQPKMGRMQCRQRLWLRLFCVLSMVSAAALATLISCTNSELTECSDDTDCATGQSCQSAGGVLTREKICLDNIAESDVGQSIDADPADLGTDVERIDETDASTAPSDVAVDIATEDTEVAKDATDATEASPVCNDGIQNGEETDIDCGGPDCPPCEVGMSCIIDSDCISGYCNPSGWCDDEEIEENDEECPLPWGGTIADGDTITAYESPSPDCSSCISETRSCDDGDLSGSYQYQDCSPDWYSEYSSWEEWSSCSASCGGGTRTRTRNCVRCDGLEVDCGYCGGDCSESQSCNTHSCCVSNEGESCTCSGWWEFENSLITEEGCDPEQTPNYCSEFTPGLLDCSVGELSCEADSMTGTVQCDGSCDGPCCGFIGTFTEEGERYETCPHD